MLLCLTGKRYQLKNHFRGQKAARAVTSLWAFTTQLKMSQDGFMVDKHACRLLAVTSGKEQIVQQVCRVLL